MDKNDLKKLLKPLIKECIREVLMEHGLNSMLAESKTPHVTQKTNIEQPLFKQQVIEKKPVVSENQKKLLEEIGKSGYMNSKFDPFSGTKPLTDTQAYDGVAPSAASSMNTQDPGIDISSLLNENANKWKALAGGKGK